jgi:hypothetical protein
MARNWVLNCDINNEKHGFVGEEDVTIRLFFQKSKPAKTPEVFLTEVMRHLPDDVTAGLARSDTRDGRRGFRLRFAYDTGDGNVYIQKNGSPKRMLMATLPEQCVRPVSTPILSGPRANRTLDRPPRPWRSTSGMPTIFPER